METPLGHASLPPQREISLPHEIDETFIHTVRAATELKQALNFKPNGIIIPYTQFYAMFSHLVDLTCDDPRLKELKKLIERIDTWQERRWGKGMPYTVDAQEGLALYSDYKKGLRSKGVVSSGR